MDKIEVFQHGELPLPIKKEIISVKSQYWRFSYESQLQWMDKNLQKGDLHFLLRNANQVIAYLNLVNINLLMDNEQIGAIGVGNVCVSKEKSNNGYGSKIMSLANEKIKSLKIPGVLLCHERLIDFYTKVGWRVLSCDNIIIDSKSFKEKVMIFNSKMFTVGTLKINRNF